jgi:hypothetical protein
MFQCSRLKRNYKCPIYLAIFLVALYTILDGSLLASTSEDKPTTLVTPPWSHCYGIHRVNQTHLSIYSGYRKKFKSPQGMAAVKLVFNDKKGGQDDDELTVYGVNSGTGEIIYNKSLTSIGFFGKQGKGEGEFRQPFGVTANNEGLVVVADAGNDRLVFLFNENNELRFLKSITTVEVSLSHPRGVCLEGDSLYAADSGNDRLLVIDPRTEHSDVFRSKYALYDPFGIAVISDMRWNYYRSRFIVVTDSLNKRLTKLSLNGKPEANVRFSEVSDKDGGFFYPAIDYYSNVYVTDTISGCIYKFDKSLRFLTRLACSRDSETRLVESRGIAIYRRFGQVFVAERAGASYFWIGTDVRYLFCEAEHLPNSVALHIRFLLTEQAKVTIKLESCDGEVLKVLDERRFMEPGTLAITYHVAENLLDREIAKCKLWLSISAKPTYSSAKFLTVEKKTKVRMP